MQREEEQSLLQDGAEIPEGARVTNDLDCVVLSSPPSFFSQIVRLAAAEKGVRYKYFTVDHTKFEHMEPWYVKLNPGAWVPTLLVAGNQPVCESMDIVLYLDKNFKGTCQLDAEITASEEVKSRNDEFMAMYNDVMVEPFSFGTIWRTPAQQFLPLMWLVGNMPVHAQIRNPKNSAQLVEIYKKKLISKAEQAREWILDQPASLDEATRRLQELLAKVEEWMSENSSEWAIGTKEYSIADVFLTVYLHRVQGNNEVLAREVLARPNLCKYYQKVLKRPTSKSANCNGMPIPSSNVMRVGFTGVLAALNGVFYLGLKGAGVNVTTGNALPYFGIFTVGILAAVNTATYIGRRRLIAFCDEQLGPRQAH